MLHAANHKYWNGIILSIAAILFLAAGPIACAGPHSVKPPRAQVENRASQVTPAVATSPLAASAVVASPVSTSPVVTSPVATLPAAASPTAAPSSVAAPVLTGLDVLERDGFRELRGRRVGVVCNATAINRRGRHIVDLMVASGNVHIVALFGPEHGIRGGSDQSVDSSTDRRTGLPVYSLYDDRLPEAERYRPTARMLRGIDTLVFDIQDIGSRYYTYITTLGYVLEAAAPRRIRVVIVDRPNPLGGEDVEGPDLDLRYRSFAGYHNMPILHGMTMGELALLFNAERSIGADITVIRMQGWNRRMIWPDTGLPWINPSPNIRNPGEAMLYGGVGFLEDLPMSVGRGTAWPFEVIGAPWIDGSVLARDLAQRGLPGVSFRSVQFTPGADKYAGGRCTGIQIILKDPRRFHPAELGIHLLDALARRYPDRVDAVLLHKVRDMIGNQSIPQAIASGQPPARVIASWGPDVDRWRARRARYLLYR